MADDLTLEAAEKIISAANKKAAQLKTRMDIAVVDAGGNLKAFARMDGAWLGSIDISIRKARTARWFDMNTGEIGKLSQPGGPLYGIEHSNDGLITFPGGVPLIIDFCINNAIDWPSGGSSYASTEGQCRFVGRSPAPSVGVVGYGLVAERSGAWHPMRR